MSFEISQLKENLSEQYYKQLKDILISLKIKENNPIYGTLKRFMISNKIYDQSMAENLKKKGVLLNYYITAVNTLENGKINILECGLKFINNDILLYCIKQESDEIRYLTDISNFKEINYDKYQQNQDIEETKSQHSSTKISGLKNRAYSLELLINYYLKEICQLIELPNFILKIAGASNFLYQEFDGVFYNKSEDEINLSGLKIAVPFNQDLIIII